MRAVYRPTARPQMPPRTDAQTDARSWRNPVHRRRRNFFEAVPPRAHLYRTEDTILHEWTTTALCTAIYEAVTEARMVERTPL